MRKKFVITQYQNKIFSMLTDGPKESRIELYEKEEETLLDGVYVARVRDLVPNIGAAFVEIAPRTACYFSLKENPDPIFLNRKNTAKVCQGDLLLVQIKKAGVRTKAPVASCQIGLIGNYLGLTREQAGRVGVSRKIKDAARCDALRFLLLPFVCEDYGFIVRTDAAEAADDEILSEMERLRSEYAELLHKASSRPAFTLMRRAESPLLRDIKAFRLTKEDEIVTDLPDVFDELSGYALGSPVRLYADPALPLIKTYDMERRLEQALSPRVWLRSGGYLIIEPTEALTVIDVNTGKYDGSGKDREQTFLKTNLEACDEIARQLILRNLSGIIIVDFINLTKPSDRSLIEARMKELLLEDPVKAVFVEFTKLDLMEITRKKIRKPLYEAVKSN